MLHAVPAECTTAAPALFPRGDASNFKLVLREKSFDPPADLRLCQTETICCTVLVGVVQFLAKTSNHNARYFSSQVCRSSRLGVHPSSCLIRLPHQRCRPATKNMIFKTRQGFKFQDIRVFGNWGERGYIDICVMLSLSDWVCRSGP